MHEIKCTMPCIVLLSSRQTLLSFSAILFGSTRLTLNMNALRFYQAKDVAMKMAKANRLAYINGFVIYYKLL